MRMRHLQMEMWFVRRVVSEVTVLNMLRKMVSQLAQDHDLGQVEAGGLPNISMYMCPMV